MVQERMEMEGGALGVVKAAERMEMEGGALGVVKAAESGVAKPMIDNQPLLSNRSVPALLFGRLLTLLQLQAEAGIIIQHKLIC